MQQKTQNFASTFEYKLIYIFRVNDEQHKGCLKIGDATIHTNIDYTKLAPNCSELNYAARKRIDEYTVTAGIRYELLHTEIAVYQMNKPGHKNHGKILSFRDYQVHEVLKRSGIKKKNFETNANEWFICELTTAKDAIKAVKENKTALTNNEIKNGKSPIAFRPEQLKAIKDTLTCFKTKDKMLWNAKMRFGKTLTALQIAKEKGFQKTIIITHRPVVEDGWFDDFDKIFFDKPNYAFGSKNKGKTINELINSDLSFVYFASMQDLRGSSEVGGNFDKNKEIFDLDWDFVVVDEAHEGIQTNLGKNVLEKVIKAQKTDHKTYVLELSGTPFNILTDFESDAIYTWDYIMEQEAKIDWVKNHFGDSNPYEELPKMNIYTYHLEEILKAYIDIEDKAFNFREFFRIWTGDIKKDFDNIPAGKKIGDFVHEDDIKSFLDLICKKSNETHYPYSTEEYRSFFRHTLWIVPGVKEAKALSSLLKKHKIFKYFDIVNVAGVGDEEIDTSDALKAVKSAITNDPDSTYTITLSCGRLTTGVSIPEWTAVLMLAGTYSTSAGQYLQTIFRVQTPANINGKMKENCYVFDFAPDRTLKMVAESVQLSAIAGKVQLSAEIQLGKFLNFCPVISIDKTGMKEFKVESLLQELKKAYAERVAKNGFDDVRLYNEELLKLDEIELKEFENLKKIVGSQSSQPKTGDIDINNTGLTDEQREKLEKIQKKPVRERTPEELEALKELAEKKKNRQSAISILRAISIRIPLLIYGIDKDIDYDITIDAFADSDLIDDNSWNEFMPNGVTKELFKKFSKYYEKDVFIAAGRRIRATAKRADELEPTERVKEIASLFATFRNPDKETVLTPWNVVNMHMSDTIGGYDFFDEKHNIKEPLDKPRFVDQKDVTKNIFNKDSKILEINSKTGLYPLYVAYSLYRTYCNDFNEDDLTFEKKQEIWDKVCRENVFVICKTPMAKQITRRTLLGYRNGKLNMHAFNDLIMQLKDKQDKFIDKVKSKSFWNVGGKGEMKFNAVVGNPPYQLEGGSGGNNDAPIFQHFAVASEKINSLYVSLIIPSRWFAAGRENLLGSFRNNMLNNKHLVKIVTFTDARDVFPNVEIKGGICYYLIDSKYIGKCLYTLVENNLKTVNLRNLNDFDILIREPKLAEIIKKIHLIVPDKNYRVDNIISNDTPFGISSNPKTSKKNPIKVYSESSDSHNTLLFHIENNKRKIEYIDRSLITKNKEYIDKDKVLITGAGGSGSDPYVLGKPEYAPKNSVCSQSYLFASFETKVEAENFMKYLKTKFLRIIVSAIKITQSAPSKVYRYVPLQDFTSNSDIDWSKSIDEIDKQLYKKYYLSEEDISFIDNKVKYME